MNALALCGLIALGFGAGSYYATGQLGVFQQANLVVGGALLVAAFLRALRRVRSAGSPALGGVLVRGLLRVALALALAVTAERIADRSGLHFDGSFQERFAISEATLRALAALPAPVEASLYADDEDPRIRSTRLLLQTLERGGRLRFDLRRLEDHPEDEDRYAVGGSNTVVVRLGERFETIDRPSEGALFEAFERLRERDQEHVIYATRGAGEGDLEERGPVGFSGLAEALATEGYRVKGLVSAAASEIPADADAVLALAPRRRLRDEALDALRAHLARGGRLIAFLEPGYQSGLEEVLAEWGVSSANAVLVDPASGPVDGDAPGLSPIVFNYGSHPAARGLDAGRMTFFRGARSFALRKPEADDQIEGIAFASGRSWLTPDWSILERGMAPARPADAQEDYHPLVVAARYPRPAGETRIVAFGDADLASNRHLRTLYNLDLVMNAVHWATEQEPEITIRPKAVVSGALQLPLPLESTLLLFQGVGLLVPELCLIAAALAWLRRRGA